MNRGLYRIRYVHPINGNTYFLRGFVYDGGLKPLGVMPSYRKPGKSYSFAESSTWVNYLQSLGYDAVAVSVPPEDLVYSSR